jgi:hypothetical protein
MNIKTKDLDVVCFETLTEFPLGCTILGQIHNCGDGADHIDGNIRRERQFGGGRVAETRPYDAIFAREIGR